MTIRIAILSFCCLICFFLQSCKKSSQIDLSIDVLTTNNLIKEVIDEINENYADEITKEKLEIGAINGMLAFLDKYSRYITQEELEILNKTARGSFLGIGIETKQSSEGLLINSVIDDSPAIQAGLVPGDIILSIDGNPVKQLSNKDIILRLNNDSKLLVTILVNRKNEKLELKLKKSLIILNGIQTNLIDDFFVIKITCFNENTVMQATKQLHKALSNNCKGLIIDLRNNSGGTIDQAISFSDLFLSDKVIAILKSRADPEPKVVHSNRYDILNGRPIVVLINSNTASSAELVAAALNDNSRAILIGQKTFGKGSIQSIIPIPGRGAIKLTTAFLFTPNGDPINNGISPKIEVSNEDIDCEKDLVLSRALDLLKGLTSLQ